MNITLASGWVTKQGGKGHGIKNIKKRYTVLSGSYLLYYISQPKASAKDQSLLKGMLYLLEASLSQPDPQSFALETRSGKEYIFRVPTSDDTELAYWKSSIQTAISDYVVHYKNVFHTGWVYKKKLGPARSAWKHRYLILKGSCLLYYTTEVDQNSDDVNYLKGWIQIASITALRTWEVRQEKNVGYHFKIDIGKNRSYIIAVSSQRLCQKWMDKISMQYACIVLHHSRGVKEKVVRGGYMLNVMPDAKERLWVVLTTKALRFYSEAVESDEHDVQVHGLVTLLPLIGMVCKKTLFSDATIQLESLSGRFMTVCCSSETEAKEWIDDISKQQTILVNSIAKNGGSIKIDTNDDMMDVNEKRFPVLHINKKNVEMHFPWTCIAPVHIPMKKIVSVKLAKFDYNDAFVLEYKNNKGKVQTFRQLHSAVNIYQVFKIAFKSIGNSELVSMTASTDKKEVVESMPLSDDDIVLDNGNDDHKNGRNGVDKITPADDPKDNNDIEEEKKSKQTNEEKSDDSPIPEMKPRKYAKQRMTRETIAASDAGIGRPLSQSFLPNLISPSSLSNSPEVKAANKATASSDPGRGQLKRKKSRRTKRRPKKSASTNSRKSSGTKRSNSRRKGHRDKPRSRAHRKTTSFGKSSTLNGTTNEKKVRRSKSMKDKSSTVKQKRKKVEMVLSEEESGPVWGEETINVVSFNFRETTKILLDIENLSVDLGAPATAASKEESDTPNDKSDTSDSMESSGKEVLNVEDMSGC